MERQFKHLKEKDEKELLDLISILEKEDLKAELRGSAVFTSDYYDLDLNVWDTRTQYRDNREIINDCLKKANAKEVYFSSPVAATWMVGRWMFHINETKFDIIYTPWGSSMKGYQK